MRPRTKANLLSGGLGVLGLFLYLWPAVAAPVVLWSDSRLDLEWARTGVGLWKGIPPEGEKGLPLHLAKPGYLLFLRAAMAPMPGREERSVVIVQSVLLWLSIAGTSLFLARRRGRAAGVLLYLLLILFLRLRDASSAVMSESISASLLLPFGAFLFVSTWAKTTRGSAAAGAISAFLFWIRPNLGGLALALSVLVLARSFHSWAALLGSFAVIFLPVWLVTAPASAPDPLRGLSHPLFAASASYYWLPSLGPWPEGDSERGRAKAELDRTWENWKRLLTRWDHDSRRELLWRALHGLLGAEFYDARWSPFYRSLDTVSRRLTPLLTLAVISLLLVFPFRDSDRAWNGTAPLFLLLLIAQNLLLGSHPRYILPALPLLLTLAALALSSLRSAKRGRRLFSLLLFGGLTAFVSQNRAVLDWEWGMLESSGLSLRQRIPAGALPREGPATFHARIAPPALPSNAHLEVLGPEGMLLYSSRRDASRRSPAIALPLPPWLLERNRGEAIEIEFASRGEYGPADYLLFPVIPHPWGPAARREGSRDLSPATGVAKGSLDWWAHQDSEAPGQ